jgi:exopolyphosphatase/guanosine-5'-triphosphate,3'-diphosphate pyrophosphatase
MILTSIDIGTNSIRLLISEVKDSNLFDIVRKVKITRLGEGMGETGLISKEAMNRTLNVLKEYKEVIDKYKISNYHAVGTSALRYCKNSNKFIERVKEETDLDVEIISGEKEAYFSFLGSTYQFMDKRTILIIDIGGGSTELVLRKEGKIRLSHSLPVGCIRLTEKYLLSDPPTNKQIKNSFLFLEPILMNSLNMISKKSFEKISNFKIQQIIGLGGTISAIASIKLGLKKYDFNKLHLFNLKLNEIENIFKELSEITLKERRRVIGLEKERTDTILGGTIILLALLKFLKIDEIIVSQRDMLDGIILSLI